MAVALGLSLITKDTPTNNATVQAPSASFVIADEPTDAQNAAAGYPSEGGGGGGGEEPDDGGGGGGGGSKGHGKGGKPK